jgi:hypothetical protein
VHVTRPQLSVPGYDVVVLNTMDGGPSHGELRRGDEVLVGAKALTTAVNVVGRDDVMLLARLSAVFVDPAGADLVPWSAGDTVLGDSKPDAPSLRIDTLTYARSHGQRPVMVQVDVNLRTGSVSVGELSGPVVLLTADDSQPIAAARALVGTGDIDALRAALSAAAKVKDPAAGAFLTEFVQTDSRMFLRKIVVELVGANRTPGGQLVLAAALSGDKNVDVRRTAARALENWGQPTEARDALAKAAADDPDVAVRVIAGRVLKKLP